MINRVICKEIGQQFLPANNKDWPTTEGLRPVGQPPRLLQQSAELVEHRNRQREPTCQCALVHRNILHGLRQTFRQFPGTVARFLHHRWPLPNHRPQVRSPSFSTLINSPNISGACDSALPCPALRRLPIEPLIELEPNDRGHA